MPPSPWLSAFVMKPRYLTLTTSTSDQKMRDRTRASRPSGSPTAGASCTPASCTAGWCRCRQRRPPGLRDRGQPLPSNALPLGFRGSHAEKLHSHPILAGPKNKARERHSRAFPPLFNRKDSGDDFGQDTVTPLSEGTRTLPRPVREFRVGHAAVLVEVETLELAFLGDAERSGGLDRVHEDHGCNEDAYARWRHCPRSGRSAGSSRRRRRGP